MLIMAFISALFEIFSHNSRDSRSFDIPDRPKKSPNVSTVHVMPNFTFLHFAKFLAVETMVGFRSAVFEFAVGVFAKLNSH